MSNSLPADMLTATDQIYLSLWNQICSLDLLPRRKAQRGAPCCRV